jgi:hypothetical protein
MTLKDQTHLMKMVAVDAKTFESVGYSNVSRQLVIRFRGMPALCFEGVPGFRYQGLLVAPRKDAYFRAYIKDSFRYKEMPPG